jgi:hypothetical protein
MSKPGKSQSSLPIIATIIVAVVGTIGTIAVAYFQFYLPEQLKIKTTLTAEARLIIAALSVTSTPTSTSLPTATVTSTPTFAPTYTQTPLPQPMVELFPQSVNGLKFVFINGTGSVVDKFVSAPQNCVHTGPYGLLLTYNLTGDANGGWGVQWASSPAKHFDASGFRSFNFWIKGINGGETFQIGLKDENGKEVKVESENFVIVTSDWTLATVPLSLFTDVNGVRMVNTSIIENVNFGFNKNHGPGSFCIDDISFAP